MVDIIIPTNKKKFQILSLIDELHKKTPKANLIPTCKNVSAAVNRNYGLMQSKSDIVIMVDDDVEGFFAGWEAQLIKPLINTDVAMVSARLLTNSGDLGQMVGHNYDTSKPLVEVECRQLPTACIAFRNDGTRFDNNYIGSGFEDNDFCFQLINKYGKGAKFLINNEVSLIHRNEMKNQGGINWKHNQSYFMNKWGIK